MKKDIAVVGISCRFLQADGPKAFWENLKAGKEMLQFYTDEELIEAGISKETIERPDFIRVKSQLEDSDSFDYPFFGYTRDEANLMDPQIRLLHELVWLALEDAACDLPSYKGKIGLCLAASENLNWQAHGLMSGNRNVDPFHLSHIINKNFVSTLISYNLDLKGPSYVVDTACSSALTAVHLACRALLLRECTTAVAGGVNLDTSVAKGYFYEEGMIASRDGHCRAFDNNATGATKGEGGGVVVLKRLEDALKDRDHIYAVIRSSATNNDGKRKVGYTAPSIVGQADCIKLAHRVANVPYNTITYIEAHGTGTRLGDPIEVEALNKAFNNDSVHKCAIGSVKTNLGHLDYAAGIAGLIKTILSLQHKMIPPSLHYQQANTQIAFDQGPFYVNTELTPWETLSAYPQRAGVSSFGIGGTNAHVILEAFEEPVVQAPSRPFQLVVYAAKTKAALSRNGKRLLNYLDADPVNLPDLAYTTKVGREAFTYRNFVAGVDQNDIIQKLTAQLKSGSILPPAGNRMIVLLFSGQGSQYYGMGKELYRSEPYFKAIMDQGFEILRRHTGEDFALLMGYTESGSEAHLLNETQYTQPALFLIEYAMAMVLLRLGLRPSFIIGHSLGEYVGACIAGVFSFEDALSIIVCRAKLMSKVPSGEMMAVAVSATEIEPFLLAGLSVAAINTEHTVVVSGNKELMSELRERLSSSGIAFSVLKTSHAFHSEMMDAILGAYRTAFEKVTCSRPAYTIISNLTGKPLSDEEAASPDYWVRHLRETVRFQEGIDWILRKGDGLFVEVGPGNTLSGFCRQSKQYTPGCRTVEMFRHPKEEVNDNLKYTVALGQLWSAGAPLDWAAYYSDEERHKVSLPGYSFDTYKLDFSVDPFRDLSSANLQGNSVKSFDEWFYLPNWKKAFLHHKTASQITPEHFLVFSEDTPLILALISHLQNRGHRVTVVYKGNGFNRKEEAVYQVNPRKEGDFKMLFGAVSVPDRVIYNWMTAGMDQEDIQSAFLTLKYTGTSLIEASGGARKKLILLGDLGYPVTGSELLNIGMITSMKIADVCAMENPDLLCRYVDIEQHNISAGIIDALETELYLEDAPHTIAYRNAERWAAFYEPITLTEQHNVPLQPGDLCLITGGLGEVGMLLAKHLIRQYKARIVIVGRSEIPGQELWQTILTEAQHPALVSRIEKMQELQALQSDTFYFNADISDFTAFGKVVSTIAARHGKIAGVIHAAGNIDSQTFKPVEHITESIAEAQFLPKIKGTINVYNLFKDTPPGFVWITSSLASILGGLTYGAYAVANRFIDAFVTAKRQELPGWYSVNLDGISEGGIDGEKLVAVFERSFALGPLPQLIVSLKDPNKAIADQSSRMPDSAAGVQEEIFVERPALSMAYQAPVTAAEEEVCRLWQSFFGYDRIGIDDNFFELGGDSLKAMTLLKRIHSQLHVEIGIEDFFSAPTIRSLAAEVEIVTRLGSFQSRERKSNMIKI